MSDQENEQLEGEGQESATDKPAKGEKNKSSAKKLTAEQKTTLARLQARPKKTILIPEDPLNPNDLVVPVSVNGVTYAIPRGQEFEVPDVIADIWRESYQKTQAANKRIIMQEDKKIVITK